MTQTALKNIRIVDFSWVVAGPMTTKMLAGMGAEVIKIETSVRSEYTNRGQMFPVLNNSKRSVTINITTEEGRDLIYRLVATCDIVVENFSDGVLRKYGLDYETLRQIKPDLIYCSASGVGRTGPQKDMLAYGTLLQAYSGRASMVGAPNPMLERMGILPAWTDPVTAMWEVLAILSALNHRRRTGEGAYIDQSMLESTVALLPQALISQALGTPEKVQSGNDEPDAAPSGCFPCEGDDKWLALSVKTDVEWHSFCDLIGRSDWGEDPSLATIEGRIAGKTAINQAAAEWIACRSPDEAERAFRQAGIFAAWSRSVPDLLVDPLLNRRGVFPTLPSGKRTTSLPWMDEQGGRGGFTESPDLGADNDYVLRKILNLDNAEVDALVKRGVIR